MYCRTFVAVVHFIVCFILQVKAMGQEAERLTETHPDQADDIRKKQSEIENNWEKLRQKVFWNSFIKW